MAVTRIRRNHYHPTSARGALEDIIRQLGAAAKVVAPKERVTIEDIVEDLSGGGVIDFSSTEQRKLEQQNLLRAPRQKQLDYLYGGGVVNPFAQDTGGVQGATTIPSANLDELKQNIINFTQTPNVTFEQALTKLMKEYPDIPSDQIISLMLEMGVSR